MVGGLFPFHARLLRRWPLLLAKGLDWDYTWLDVTSGPFFSFIYPLWLPILALLRHSGPLPRTLVLNRRTARDRIDVL